MAAGIYLDRPSEAPPWVAENIQHSPGGHGYCIGIFKSTPRTSRDSYLEDVSTFNPYFTYKL